ncbi:MAG: long-chain fatty acid--CoA ligase [Thermoplasmata archaeon]|nr:long-chain fatty acid--CoA ligase [Thermoplasmata archaeon]
MNPKDFQLNINSIFPSSLWTSGNQEIVYQDIKRYTYREFYDRVRRFANGLVNLGVKPGDKVAVLDWDTYHYLESYYAVPMIGAVLHTVNIRYPPEIIFYTMNHAGDKFVIIRDEFLPMVERAATLFDFVKGWIVYSDTDEEIKTTLNPYYNYEHIVESSEPIDPPDIDEKTIATLFYTSGTTGLPKGVTFSHRKLILHAQGLAMSISYSPLNITEKDVFLGLVPMFHVHSWGVPYLAIMTGKKYVLPGRYDVKKILEMIKNEHVTFSHMVPSILYMILTYHEIEQYAKYLNGWKVIIGGAALPKGLAKMAKSFGITTVGAYGMSETCPLLTAALFTDGMQNLPEEEKFDYMISTGKPAKLVNLRIVDSNYKDVPWDNKTIGEIIVRAPWLTDEYYKDPEKTEELWKDGWLHTGDLAVVDSGGYIHIVDREKDAVKSGGEFIPSLILENIISEIPEVGEVAVIGRPDPKWGERPIAFITLKSKTTKEKIMDELFKFVDTGRIQKWWIPDDIIFIDSMPKTSTGKIDKKELRTKL